MKKYIVYLLFMHTLIPLSIHAEGPPIRDNDIVDFEYTAIALTASQKIQLITSRVITLTDQQARESGMTNHDRQLYILTSNYHDCTCGLTYGIWFHPDSIITMGENYSSYDTLGEGKLLPGRCLRAAADNLSNDSKMQSLYISVSGDLYYMDKKISLDTDSLYITFDTLAANINKLYKMEAAGNEANTENELHRTFLFIPPIRLNANREKVLYTFYLLSLQNRNNIYVEYVYQ